MKNKNPGKNNSGSSSSDGNRTESKAAKETGNAATVSRETEAEQVLEGSLLQMLHELDGQEFILTIPIENGGDKDE